MILREKINILGRTFKVEYIDFDEVYPVNNEDGTCYISKLRIQIDSKNPREVQESTLLHEMLHAISDALELGFEEKTIKRFEAGLYQVLNDNGFLRQPSDIIKKKVKE
jgi:Zn-dependent peptidase ImmA (M78 family)